MIDLDTLRRMNCIYFCDLLFIGVLKCLMLFLIESIVTDADSEKNQLHLNFFFPL